MSALNTQVGGSHYKDLKIQPVEYIHANGIGFMEGNVVKYVTRWRDKNGIKDLEKAKHYIELLIEIESKAENDDKSENDNEGWIEWDGANTCPVKMGTSVDLKYFDGRVRFNVAAMNAVNCRNVNWWWRSMDCDMHDDNIVAYRISKGG